VGRHLCVYTNEALLRRSLIIVLRVLIIHPELPVPGRKASGVAVMVDRIARALHAGSDVEVTVAGLDDAPQAAPYRYRRLLQNAPSWLQRLLRTGPGRVFLWPLLLNFVRLPASDVIHFHGDDGLFLRRSRRRPTIRTMHGASWRELQHTRSLLRKMWLACILPMELSGRILATRTLAIGSDTARLYRTRHRIGNSVADGIFYPGEKSQRPTVFYNGWWRGRKRGEFMYRCFVEQVLPEFPDAELWFLADECPEHPSVRHVCGISDDELGRLYREAWVVGYPSTYEGFGLVYLEAMASGTALVVTPNAGAEDVIGDSGAGAIVDDKNFAEQLVALLGNVNLRDEMAAAGLLRAEDFSVARVAEDHVRHFRELVGASGEKAVIGGGAGVAVDRECTR